MMRNYREHVIDAQPDNRVGVWRQGRKEANIRYVDTHRWRADLILKEVGEDKAPPSQHQDDLGGTGFRRNEFEQLQDAIDAVIDRLPADAYDEAARQMMAFFEAE